MNTKQVCLFLNGESPKSIPDLKNYNMVCATDGACTFLKANNIVPHFISGDFDSIKTIPDSIEVIHTPNQDFTDFDKILQILFDRGFSDIHVYGASGQEQDHFLGNLHTALQWKTKLKITFFDNYGFYFLADTKVTLTQCLGKHVSLFPFPEANGIITRGLQYALNDESLFFGGRIGTRNKAIEDTIEISFKTGNMFLFIND
ncbi:thiamine diphosphokinase [Algibacter amylolyticus]|uniref:Thiamine diphosphokinase n=1 Tax=Algibacter amylolyticus TaxID=1608400 RepID=A0A5M7B1C8_9FLAO|nr:thiamine diphosphokinase [Algibacter amylolyticus]KAA5821957.1 thiamine diphosphokinase [Algibacter amylolyticus]MBB5269241.1 thiamine pyrophosphokinase [Algibacter amylolyticus]TSJ73241.1 thiamine diphosphokinase [Algibacter amylolyticus]